MSQRSLEAPLQELAKELEQHIAARTVEDIQIHVRRGTLHHARLGAGTLSSCGTERSLNVRVTVFHQQRSASASLSSLESDALHEATKRASEIAAASPPNPEFLPPPEQWTCATRSPTPSMAATPEQLLAMLEGDLSRAKARTVLLSGFLQAAFEEDLLCSSRCSPLIYEESSSSLSLTARTARGTGSGKARWSGERLEELVPNPVAEEAIRLAVLSDSPQPIAPGSYPTIFAPSAAADLVGLLATKMLKRPADEGRGVFSRPNRRTALGEKLLAPQFSLYSDPHAPGLRSRPFTQGGEAIEKTDWISSGVLTALQTDRYWARTTSTSFVAPPTNLIVPGTNKTLNELIAETERAILVHHLWYIRMVDEASLTATGLTRDGVFLVEDGEIRGALHNLRFNDSPLHIFAGTLRIGESTRTESNEVEDYKMHIPSIAVPAVRYTASSDAV